MKLLFIQPFIIGALFLFNQAYAQGPNSPKSLELGDKVPDIVFSLTNSSKEKLSLADLKGKIIILDFWSTTCTGCVYQFPKMDSIQQQFGDRIKVLLVNSVVMTGESREKIDRFFERSRSKGKNYTLETAIGDSVAARLFPFQMIPHYVWIDKEGEFIAATSSEQVTRENINALLEDRPVVFRQKKDRIDFDENRPLFVQENGGVERNVKYKSVLTGYLDGVAKAGSPILSRNKMDRLFMTNVSLLTMYRRLFNNRFYYNRFIIASEFIDKFRPPNVLDESWKYDNEYSYELITHPTTRDSLCLQMKEDLKRYLGITAIVQHVKTKCLVIQRKGPAKKLSQSPMPPEKAPKGLITSVADLRTNLDYNLEVPVIDESGYKEKIRLVLPDNFTDLSILRKSMEMQGLDLVEAEREVEMVVLTVDPQSPLCTNDR